MKRSILAATTATHCPYCALQCGILLRQSTSGVNLTPDPSFPVNRGALCIKGWTAAQLLRHADRLLTPMESALFAIGIVVVVISPVVLVVRFSRRDEVHQRAAVRSALAGNQRPAYQPVQTARRRQLGPTPRTRARARGLCYARWRNGTRRSRI